LSAISSDFTFYSSEEKALWVYQPANPAGIFASVSRRKKRATAAALKKLNNPVFCHLQK